MNERTGAPASALCCSRGREFSIYIEILLFERPCFLGFQIRLRQRVNRGNISIFRAKFLASVWPKKIISRDSLSKYEILFDVLTLLVCPALDQKCYIRFVNTFRYILSTDTYLEIIP